MQRESGTQNETSVTKPLTGARGMATRKRFGSVFSGTYNRIPRRVS